MKLVTAFMHHIRTSDVVQALADAKYRNISLDDVKGMLRPITDAEEDYSSDTGAVVISETRLTLVCEDHEVDEVTTIIRATARIGPHISGWVYVSPVDRVMSIGDSAPPSG